jgi:hypothetical protein
VRHHRTARKRAITHRTQRSRIGRLVSNTDGVARCKTGSDPWPWKDQSWPATKMPSICMGMLRFCDEFTGLF